MRLSVATSILFSVLVAAQLVSAAPADEVDCSKMDTILDEYGPAQGYTSLQPKYPLISTAEEHAARCQVMTDTIKLLRKYNSKCYTGLTQQVFSAILHSRAAFNELYCKPGTPEFSEVVDAMKCVKENSLDKMQAAEREITVMGQSVLNANIADEKLRTRRCCCTVLDGTKALMSAFNDKCKKYEKLFDGYMESYRSEAMGLICPADDKLQCDKLEKLKTDGEVAKDWFFMNPILKIVKTLDH